MLEKRPRLLTRREGHLLQLGLHSGNADGDGSVGLLLSALISDAAALRLG